jgi:hypothetical protein
MKCIKRIATYSIALLAFSAFSIRCAVATQVTLNFVPESSTMTWGGFFGGQPFIPQDTGVSPPAGTTDFNAVLPSNATTHQGTITVDVDNLLAPSSIQIVSSSANSDASGKWLPQDYAFLPNDVDGDLNLYEFPDDASSSVGTTPGAAADADFGIRIRPAGAPDVAYSALRDMSFNITTPPAVPVDGLGQFSSTTENFEYATGWWDYWLHPTFTAEKLRQRLEVAGGDNNNTSAVPSTYVATPLGGGTYQITLTIPVLVNDPDDTAPTSFTGTLVATFTTPEPTSLVLLSLAGGLFGLFRVRHRQ